jgi:PadR family transcriptional regulator PadR
MNKQQADLLQGTLDLLILRVLQQGPMHGWGVAQRIHLVSRDALTVNQGSLYPALHRLENRAWIQASWGTSENNRRAKYYRLTAKGKEHLERESREWKAFSLAVNRVLAKA